MANNRNPRIEYRHYDINDDYPFIIFNGEEWIRRYEKGRLHFHNHLEIGYCYWGDGRMIVNGDTYRYKKGDFTFIPQNIPHTTESDGETYSKWGYVFINLDGLCKQYSEKHIRFLKKLNEKTKDEAVIYNHEEYPVLGDELINVIERQDKVSSEFNMVMINLLTDLFVHFASEIIGHELKEEDGKKNVVSKIAPAIECIKNNFHTDIRIEELAELCLLSETYFRRCFTNTIGVSPLAYINLIRVQQSCELLNNSQYSVQKIADLVGYNNLTTYERNFKKVIGISPNEWKKANEGKHMNLSEFSVRILEGWT